MDQSRLWKLIKLYPKSSLNVCINGFAEEPFKRFLNCMKLSHFRIVSYLLWRKIGSKNIDVDMILRTPNEHKSDVAIGILSFECGHPWWFRLHPFHQFFARRHNLATHCHPAKMCVSKIWKNHRHIFHI